MQSWRAFQNDSRLTLAHCRYPFSAIGANADIATLADGHVPFRVLGKVDVHEIFFALSAEVAPAFAPMGSH